MKISFSNSGVKYSPACNNKKNNFSKQLTEQKNLYQAQPQLCAAYYNNISFSAKSKPLYMLSPENRVHCRVPLNSGAASKLTLDPDMIDGILTDDGSINENLLQKFLELYQSNLQDIIDDNAAKKDSLNAVIRREADKAENTNIEYVDFIRGISYNKVKEDMDRMLLDSLNIPREEMEKRALEKTFTYIEFFGKEAAFDLSTSEQKEEFVRNLGRLSGNYPDIDIDDFISCVKDETGSVDFDYARNLYQFINTVPVYEPENMIKHHDSILKSFSAMDEKNSNAIMKSAIQLAYVFPVESDSKRFEDVFIEAFNPKTGKFDQNSFELLLKVVPAVIDKTESIEINSPEDLEFYNNCQISLIKGYFTEVRDEQNGCIPTDRISIEDYLLQN